jgi:ribose transport system ATP-binding protein
MDAIMTLPEVLGVSSVFPGVLLLDEPIRGIDIGAKAEVQTLIDELAFERLGVVLVSSAAGDLIEGADRVVVLRDGVVVGILIDSLLSIETLPNTIATVTAEDNDGKR